MFFEIMSYIYHQGTYTPQVSGRLRAGSEKGAGFILLPVLDK